MIGNRAIFIAISFRPTDGIDQPALPIEDGGKRTVGSISFVPAVAGLKLSEYVVTALLEEKEKEEIPQ